MVSGLCWSVASDIFGKLSRLDGELMYLFVLLIRFVESLVGEGASSDRLVQLICIVVIVIDFQVEAPSSF